MFEIIVAHIVVQVIVMTLQNALSFTVLYAIFDNPMRGSMALAWLIVSLNELTGMVFGEYAQLSQNSFLQNQNMKKVKNLKMNRRTHNPLTGIILAFCDY